MLTIYIDADACPVKDEVYRIARRYALRVMVVANAPLRIPTDGLMEMVVRSGFGAADDWIVEQLGDVFGSILIPEHGGSDVRCSPYVRLPRWTKLGRPHAKYNSRGGARCSRTDGHSGLSA